ncbi:nucleoside hydrolase [Dyadobacter sp. LHD-138]|uniref:nucleoside hydrolase n=1 Tax=Dyadobacter sp. LHD-138 TaxID=3071413 RepID=UPI0027DF3E25|nr:nucleoside hydrolase [Dyadobacter sp. LHD-138]MDQ6478484.1 nucleoside hydrolase [Dyadobacter sp. LHD-138]
MKYLLSVLSLFISLYTTAQISRVQKVSLILDTDIGPDYDDVGAMAVMHALADRGEVKPLAVIASNKNALVAPTIEIINNYFGRPEIPVAAPKGKAPDMGAPQKWPEMLLAKYPHKIKSTDEVPDAVETYRKILASQPDQSVTIVTVGFLTNLSNLLNSGPDKFSALSGTDLVKRKVKEVVAMAGAFPKGREFNVMIDSVASENVFAKWPTQITFSGVEIGNGIKTGLKLIANESLDSPVKHVYALAIPLSKNDSEGRMSWDQTAVLVAIRGAQHYFDLKRGKIVINGGTNEWRDDPMGPHAYLTQKMGFKELGMVIESLMMQKGSGK